MPRALRVHLQDGIYLVEQQSREPRLFESEDDYCHFLSQLQPAIRHGRVRIHAYCLLPWAFHFVVQIEDLPLSRFMHSLMRRYACDFNKRHLTTGSRLQGRYSASLIESNELLLKAVRDVHRQPQLTRHASMSDYRWSSHLSYLGQAHTEWLTTVVIEREFGAREIDALNGYSSYMAQQPSNQDSEDGQANHVEHSPAAEF